MVSLAFTSRFMPGNVVSLSCILLACGFAPLHALDCNLNDVDDTEDVQSGFSEDCNLDGVPDECEFVPISLGATGESLALSLDAGAAASADFDGDGVTDLAVGSSALGRGSSVMLFLSEGAGRFQPEATYEAGSRVVAMETGDVDLDGNVDLVTVDSDQVILLPGIGDGTFGAPTSFPIPLASRGLILTDWSGDGRLDFLTRNRRLNSVTWVPNPSGEAATGATFEVAADPVAFAAADFDRDGRTDLAIAGEDEGRVSVLVQRAGNPAAGDDGPSLEEWASLPSEPPFGALRTDDIDSDGAQDLFLGGRTAFGVWRNPGDGRFDEATLYPVGAHQLVLVDMDSDGSRDVLAGAIDFNTLHLLRSQEDGTLGPPQPLSVDYRVITHGDYDGDGDVDLAFPAAAPSIVTILWQGESGLPGFSQEVKDAVDRPHGIATGDVTGDGIADILTSNSAHQTYSLFPGRGDGTFDPVVVRNLGETLSAVAIGDFDKDGNLDAMFRATSGLRVFLNPAATDFGESTVYSTRGDFQYLSMADVDGDGSLDALAPLVQQQTLSVHFNNGQGDFSEKQILFVRQGPRAARAGDLDGDGDADLATANRRASSVSLLYQIGPKEFGPEIVIPIVGGPHDLQIQDFDQDGRQDIAVANAVTEDIALLWNDGAGSFSAPQRIRIHRSPFGLWADDLTGDGVLELITTNESAHSVTVFRGRPGGTFAPPQSFATGTGPRFTVTLDAEGDGDLDLAVANRRSAEVSIILNHIESPDAGVEFLEQVCTALDFDRLAVFGLDPHATQKSTRFLVPISPVASLPPLYANANRLTTAHELPGKAAPELFGELGEDGFLDLVGRRATREHFAGTISRVATADGTVYGIDFVVASADETLQLEEVRDALTAVRQSFLLEPVVYVPSTREARERAAEWSDPDVEVLLLDKPPTPPDPEPPQGTPTFTLEVPRGTMLCGVFVEANVERGPPQERIAKSVVRLRGGTVTLPTTEPTFEHDLFETVDFGPSGERLTPQSPGEFRVQRIPAPDGETVFRFLYSQPFVLASGSVLELEISAPLEYRARGDEALELSRPLPPEYYVTQNGLEPLQASLDGVPLVRYGSCHYETLTLWSVEAVLADGTELRFAERFDEAESLLVTAPAALVHAQVRVRGTERVVTNYYDLIYSGFRHNQPVDYWVLFDNSVDVPDVGEVHGVELRAPDERLRPQATATYLNAAFDPIASIDVQEFRRRTIDTVAFRRGDVDSDTRLTVRDPIVLVSHLFRRGAVGCRKAADVNDDGKVGVTDAIALVSHLFGARQPLPAPFGTCGEDPSVDGLSCQVPALCE